MFGPNMLTPTHLLLVLVVVMLVFGTKKLPELGRGLGSAMREFKGGITGSEPAQALEAPAAAAEAAPEQPKTTVAS